MQSNYLNASSSFLQVFCFKIVSAVEFENTTDHHKLVGHDPGKAW